MSWSDIWLFLQQGLLSGLVTGSVYALLALAIVAIFKTTDVPNFAQGEMLMMAGYVALMLLLSDVPYAAVIFMTLIAMALVGALFQRVVMERVTGSRGVGVQLVIATLGLAYVLKGLVRQTGLGDTPRSLPALFLSDTVMIGDAVGFFGIAQRLYLAYASIWILVTASWLLRALRSAASVPLSP